MIQKKGFARDNEEQRSVQKTSQKEHLEKIAPTTTQVGQVETRYHLLHRELDTERRRVEDL